ncbi:MAG TPA: monovalent cation/H+ antiporter subunit A [Myxococcaceae bacterium]|nr:monovalent cation/H+ antiporter subunit A [Myxococcaceae bacterium]
MPLLTFVLLPFGAAFLAGMVPTHARTRAPLIAGIASVVSFVGMALLFPGVENGGVISQRIPWMSSAGIDLVFRLDGFSWLFGMMVFGIGALVVLYAHYYLSSSDPASRFFAFFLAFMASMAGVVLSGNLIQLVFFWELTSIVSFLLIGYWYHRKDAQRGARMSLTVTGMGGLCLLAGVLILGNIVGSFDLDVVLANRGLIHKHPLYAPMLVLILLGVFTKSAQFPFHFWLPNAMAAPTPVSAYLHSATMVKAGVFLLGRLWPVLSGTELWFWMVGGVGLTTLLIGAYVAVFQNDLKGLLAYSTISNLGLITLLFGLNSKFASVAAVFHILNHATFKASLFMAAGIVDHETGTRDIRRLSGLRRQMPVTATLAVVASAAMAGVPLLNGFISKEMFFAETVYIQSIPLVEYGLPLLACIAGMGSVAYSLRFIVDVFFGPSCVGKVPLEPEEPPVWMRLPVTLLVLACIIVGVAPAAVVGRYLNTSAGPVVGGVLPEYSLALWHGFNEPLVMSIIAMTVGIAGYLFLRYARQRGRLLVPPVLSHFSGNRAFVLILANLTAFAHWFRNRLLVAGLQRQILAMMLVVFAVGTGAIAMGGGPGTRAPLPLSPSFALLWLVGGLASIATAWQAKYHRPAAIILMSVAGLVNCVTFLWFSAPDLALTQLVVEVVMTLLLLLGLRWLPQREPKKGIYNARTRRQARVRRTRDLIISVSVGLGMAGLALALSTRTLSWTVAPFFLEHALSEGGGRNVVNVMLVDFRGFDTFGEGVVLSLVALTIYALLRRFRPAPEIMALPPQQRALPTDLQTDLLNPRHAKDTAVGYLMVPAVLVRMIFPIVGVIGVFFFIRGHNEPGGGFVAGLVVSVSILLQYVVSGTEWVEAHLNVYPRRLIAAGLLTIAASGAGSFVAGYPLLTSHTWHFHLPLFGEVHFASATFFDLGVFLLVVGSTLFILVALAHQSVRAHRHVEDH